MEAEIDSMDSNLVWELVDLPEWIKRTGVSGSTRRKEIYIKNNSRLQDLENGCQYSILATPLPDPITEFGCGVLQL
ncbi:hypothetical protein EPI10_005965 [Gossypium australe]|uniref:Uncharacterized protein n=1 Tax=Gossypium australe TaxID=47621 RepID=A0A5B6WPL3_9ROSI|nr:hypothetical protein EPI10_005965 [Gossypium australe]